MNTVRRSRHQRPRCSSSCLASRAQSSSQARGRGVRQAARLVRPVGAERFVGEGIGQSLSAEGLRNAQPVMGSLCPSTPRVAGEVRCGQGKRSKPPSPRIPIIRPRRVTDNCASPPFIMNMVSPAIYEWRITPEETTIVDTINGIRHIYTDGRSHPPSGRALADQGRRLGRALGGDTLVVDTVAIKPDVLLQPHIRQDERSAPFRRTLPDGDVTTRSG